MAEAPFISVVVPAFNEEYSLPSCLQALHQQDYPGRFEIIVVNNVSTDGTAEIAAHYGCRVVNEPRKGYVHALMRGFAEAHGDIIASTDADTLVKKNWFSKIVKNLSAEGVVACSGAFVFFDGPWWIRILGWLFGRCNWHLAGANMAVWRWAFVKAGGFKQRVNMGADVELGFRLRQIGRLIIDRSLVARTSSRRFQLAFWETLFRYYVNDLFLAVFRRPLFYGFVNYRLDARGALAAGRFSRLAFSITIVVFFSWLSQYTAREFLGTVFARGESAPTVALTFDDGPSSPYTAQILDILRTEGVAATFFVVGENAEKYPELVKRIALEGHAVENHTFSHDLPAGNAAQARLADELDETALCIRRLTGSAPVYYRPPEGRRLSLPWLANQKKGLTVVPWTVNSKDSQRPDMPAIIDNVTKKIKPGAIVLLHDGLAHADDPRLDHTVDALPLIIDDLKARGYRFVTIPELFSTWDHRILSLHFFAGAPRAEAAKAQL